MSKTSLPAIIAAVTAASILILFTVNPGWIGSASAHESHSMISGRGHGVLFDGEVREQAGVPEGVVQSLWEMQDQLTKWRRDIHRHPEIGHKEEKTHKYILEALSSMDYKPKPFGDTTGIILDVPGKDKTFTIGIRADIDGLPITEADDGREYRSEIEGQCHACGHDAHTTIVLGVAKALADGVFEAPANLRLIFQPAEELGTGAQSMIDAGVLEGVDVVIGLHCDPTREWGRIGMTDGSFSAYANGFSIEVTGRAAHGGMSPEKGRDAIVGAAHVVTQLQSIVSRNVAPPDASTITVGTFNGGSVANQVADKAVLTGTMRAQNGEIYETVKERMTEVVEGASKSMDMPMKIEFPVELPGTINNPAMFKALLPGAQTVVGEENVDVYNAANMAGEDFAAYSQQRPSFFFWLGIANKEKGITHTLHTPEFDIDERALVVGVALQIQNVLKLAEHHAQGKKF